MRSGLKSVGSKSVADDYIKNDSMKLTRKTDLFLYEKVERRKKPKENDSGGSETHTSSSGTTHGAEAENSEQPGYNSIVTEYDFG